MAQILSLVVTPVVDAIARAEKAASRTLGKTLRQRLGTAGMLRVMASVAWSRLQGEPWTALGPPSDERDRLSRRQAGDLVLLDRAVEALAGPEVAREVSREAVMAGALPFLEAMIPPFPVEKIAQLADELTSRFFNAEGNTFWKNQNTFHFEVSRCRFVELLDKVGASHLAPLFCEADQAFFNSDARPITLRRTRTLAQGGLSCDFQFTVRSK